MTAERRAAREQLRREAGERFAAGDDNAVIAKELRVHVRSVQRRRAAWSKDGLAAGVQGVAESSQLSAELPAYAPQLNPVEGIWSLIRRALANTTFTDREHLIRAVRRQLRSVQHRPWLIDGAVAGTGLELTPIPP